MMNCTGKRCIMQYGKVDPATCEAVDYCPEATPPKTNSDYIEREEAILAVDERIKQIGYEGSPLVLSIRQSIRDVPSADVKPVVHGRWDGYGRCTACGMFWDEMRTMDGDDTGYWYEMPPYCNNCGAKMDGET